MRNSNGTFAKGNKGKPKGTPNKTTSEIRDAFQLLIEDNASQLKKDIASLEPKERLNIIINLAKFILPKPSEILVKEEHTIDFNELISFESD